MTTSAPVGCTDNVTSRRRDEEFLLVLHVLVLHGYACRTHYHLVILTTEYCGHKARQDISTDSERCRAKVCGEAGLRLLEYRERYNRSVVSEKLVSLACPLYTVLPDSRRNRGPVIDDSRIRHGHLGFFLVARRLLGLHVGSSWADAQNFCAVSTSWAGVLLGGSEPAVP